MQSDAVADNSGLLRAPCPKCGSHLHEEPGRIRCQNCDFVLWRTIANRRFRTSELEELISTGSAGPFRDFRSKSGRSFAATLKFTSALRIEFDLSAGTSGVTPTS